MMGQGCRTANVMVLALLAAVVTRAATVVETNVWSRTMGKSVPVSLVMPHDYGWEGAERYPVAYLLHGYGGDHREYLEKTGEVTNAVDRYGFIAVCPDGMVSSWWVDSPVDPKVRYETFVADELVRWTDANFQTQAERGKRAIVGASMGGFGALSIVSAHKDVFGAVGAIHPGVELKGCADNGWDIDKRLGPLDANEGVWDEHSVLNRVKSLENGEVSIFVTIGTSDEYFLRGNRALHEQLTKDGIEHVYTEIRGSDRASSAHNFTFQAIGEREIFPRIAAFFVTDGPVRAEEPVWLSVPEAPVCEDVIQDGSRAADGTSWFAASRRNAAEVRSAKWTVSGLGVFDVYVNGRRVGDDFLKPGFTHYAKTKYSFSYDVTSLMKTEKDAENWFAAEVSAGWWRDKVLTPAGHRGFMGRKSAFRGELEITYADGTKDVLGTNPSDWKCGISGPVTHAAIFDGEEYDARVKPPVFGEGLKSVPEVNEEFGGEILPSAGAEICLRRDLAMKRGPFAVRKGETLVVDFGQNCAAVPEFVFTAKRGTVLTALPGEMLNDADKGERGCDGPKGSVYRANLRIPDEGMRIVYTFSGEGKETYLPRFTYFGYRYLSITASGDVEIESVSSIPVTSIRKEMEIGTLEVGDAALNRFIRNVYWGQLSNYLSVPTDCPQRNERLGWMADTQIFCEAGAFNADIRTFFRKFTRDMRDGCSPDGGYPYVAPYSQYCNDPFGFGWADAGVIVPWTIWRQFDDREILKDNYDAMAKFVRRLDETKYDFEGRSIIHGNPYCFADWLSYEKFESCGNRFGDWKKWEKDPAAMDYRRFLAACYWLYDAGLMAEMSEALGKDEDAAWFRESAARAKSYIRTRFLEADGLLLRPMRDVQTACVFALRFGIVEGRPRADTKAHLLKSIADHGGCLQTGFLGTSFLMDALALESEWETAYGILFQHKNPSWLYSVDQGATTVWERWNSYTKKEGFGPVSMNSFNHYAYGAVLAWIYKHAAGIDCDPKTPGFKKLRMAPKPDRRLGFVKASYRSVSGLVKSEWHYEGETWVWRFSIPEGVTAEVVFPWDRNPVCYRSGTYQVRH